MISDKRKVYFASKLVLIAFITLASTTPIFAPRSLRRENTAVLAICAVSYSIWIAFIFGAIVVTMGDYKNTPSKNRTALSFIYISILLLALACNFVWGVLIYTIMYGKPMIDIITFSLANIINIVAFVGVLFAKFFVNLGQILRRETCEEDLA